MVKFVVFASLIASAAAGACSDDEKATITGMSAKDFGDKSNKCGTQALGLTGINHDKFNSCMKTEVGIDTNCAECYAVTADYGFKNCKASCLLGWCKSGCLSCTQPAQDDLPACTGFEAGTADPCLESTGGCSADDQTALSDATTVGEKQDACGKKALGLSGIDHDKFTSCVQSDLGISASCSECYYTVADYGFKNCKAACLLGWCKSGCLSCTQPAQDDLSGCTGFAPSTAQPCLESTATGGCSADDQTALSDATTVGEKQDACGKKALGLSGIDHDKFTSCVQSDLGISASCSECYYTVADYGFKNCKAACLLGWCKSGCLSCTQPAQDDLSGCTGFSPSTAQPCLETKATGACSADDQGKLGDSATVGKAGSDCGLGAYNVLTGNFNHDKFNTCFTGKLGLSSSCSECYATNGEFAATNCKAACLLGWCKQGCLDCSTADAPKAALDACTGFTSGSADPCMDDIAV